MIVHKNIFNMNNTTAGGSELIQKQNIPKMNISYVSLRIRV